jgi:hypothetical protein
LLSIVPKVSKISVSEAYECQRSELTSI